MIVVDTNILVSMYLRNGPAEERTELAYLLLEKDPQWHAPAYWRTEFANVLCTNVRYAGLRLDEARHAWKRAGRAKNMRDHEPSLTAALELSLESQVTVYDGLFLSLARALRTVCVTHDQAMQKAAPGLAVGIKEFLRA